MKLLLRLALLTLCGAAGVMIAVHVAASRPAEAETVVASWDESAAIASSDDETADVRAAAVGRPVSEKSSAGEDVAKEDEANAGRLTPAAPEPRTAQQAPTIPNLPGVDLSVLQTLPPEQVEQLMNQAVELMQRQNGAGAASNPADLLQMLQRGGGGQAPGDAQAAQLNQLLQTLQRAQQQGGAAAPPPVVPQATEPLPVGAGANLPGAASAPGGALQLEPLPPTVVRAEDGRLIIHSRDADVRNLLEQLAEQAGLNILASENVQGTVTVNLQNVTMDEALATVLRATGYVSRRDGNILYVGTTADFEALEKALDRISMRVYRPNYLNAKELSNLLTPLVTPGVGKISVTTPPATGIAPDNTTAGGDSISQQDAIVVQDYERVLVEIDQVYRELDRRPSQVSIEAVIVSVTLNDANSFGVDFQVLRDQQHVRFGWGNPRQAPLQGGGTVDPVTGANIGQFQFDTGGLKFAFLDDTLGVFLNALETVGDANVIASPKLLCLNKQKAEILIGQRLGYISTTVTQNFSTQNVEFLDVGAQLRLRPFIAADGMIRMEVHPELSEGEVVVSGGFTLPRKTLTEVTTNVMCPDGCTVIIGGLMRENLRSSSTQVPLFGSLPLAGPLFRNKTENVERTEILVLLTPRIVENGEIAGEGAAHFRDTYDMEGAKFHRMSPIGKAHLSRDYLLRAQAALRQGDRTRAQRFARLAVHYDPLHREAVRFYAQLNGGGRTVEQGWGAQAIVGEEPPLPVELDGAAVPEWMLNELGGEGLPPPPLHPREPGLPGRAIDIQRQEIFGHDKP